mgnify:CR=1 FL=1
MQLIRINRSTTLAQLTDMVGSRNVDIILNYNGLFERVPNIGQTFFDMCNKTIIDISPIDYLRRDTLLKKYAKDSLSP